MTDNSMDGVIRRTTQKVREREALMATMFGRINSDGNVDILHVEDGERVTRIEHVLVVYPVGSSLSTHYEHPEGIVLTRGAAKNLGIELEDA